jgi:urease accessory protein UreF
MRALIVEDEKRLAENLAATLRDNALCADGAVALAARRDAIRPADAKRSDVRKILNIAARHFEELVALWEGTHGDA